MPTTNPVPSQDPSDLLFNAGKLDEVVNGTANSFTDRLGATRRTVAGMNADFDAQLADAESDLNVYRADAAASAAEALGYLQTIRATSYGAYAEDPTTDPLGNPPTVGDEYFNTTSNLLKRWNGTTWQASDINTANLAASSGSSLVGYQPADTGAVAATVQSKLRETVSVKDFGAVGDGVADDSDAIQNAINAVSTTPGLIGMALLFPSGVYRVTKTLTVDRSGVSLVGVNEKGALSYSPVTTAGSHILYGSNDGGPILKIGGNTQYRYHNKIHGIRVGAIDGLSVKPIGIQMNACSEATLSQFHINGGCSVGLALNACGIIRINNFDVAANDVGIDMYVNTAISGATLNSSIWLTGANIWQSSQDAIRIRGTSVGVSIRDSWIEYAQNIFNIEQQSDAEIGVRLSLYNLRASVGAGGASDSRFIRCRAFDGGSNSLRVQIRAYDCETFNSDSTHNIVYTKGTNTSSGSYLNQAQFDNCTFYGASTAVLTSDTTSSTAFFTGQTDARSAYASGSVIPLVADSARMHRMTSEAGYWDMTGGYPIRLPTVDALSFSTNGQFYFQSSRYRLAFTANGNRVFLPRPLTTTYADESVTVNVTDSAETLRFNTALTANRTVTLSTTNTYNGAKFRVYRTAAATGAFNIDVGGLKALSAAGQWCDVEHDGTAWRLTAAGSL